MTQNTKDQEHRMTDSTTPQDSAATRPASAGSVDALSTLRKLRDGVRGMGIGDPDSPDRIEASDIVRWAIDEIEQQRGSLGWYEELLREAEEKMVRMSLTDAEREAIATASRIAGAVGESDVKATLRGLLERLEGRA